MKTNTLISGLLITCASVFAGESPISRNENVREILKTTYLSEPAAPLLNMFAAEAVASLGDDKTADSDQLIEQLHKQLEEEFLIAKFANPYSNFSDEEIDQIRAIYQTPVYIKFQSEQVKIYQSNIQTIRDTLKELANQYATQKKTDETATSTIIEITEENFAQEIEQSDKPVIIDFYGNSCPPCRLMEPIFENLSRQYEGKIRFARVNCETQFELVKRYEIAALPTLLFIHPGKTDPAIKIAGFLGKKNFQAKISEFLSTEEIAKVSEQ